MRVVAGSSPTHAATAAVRGGTAGRHDPRVPSAKKVASLSAPVHLQVEPGTPLPDLALRVGSLEVTPERARAATVDVRYLDTADLRLLRAGIVLSRRATDRATDGTTDEAADAVAAGAGLDVEPGWVLELPAPGTGTRAVHLPLRGSSTSAPRQLTSLLRATVRAGRLTTVAQVRSELELHHLTAAVPVGDPGSGPGADPERTPVLEVLARTTTATLPPAPAGAPGAGAHEGVSVTTTRELQVRAPHGELPWKPKQVRALAEDVVAALTAAGAEPCEPPAEAGSAAQLRAVLAEGGPRGTGALATATAAGGRSPAKLTSTSPAAEVARAALVAALGAVTAADRDVRAQDGAGLGGAGLGGAGLGGAGLDGAGLGGAGLGGAGHEALLLAVQRLRGAVELVAASGAPGGLDDLEAGLARIVDVLAAALDDHAVAAALTAQIAAEPGGQVLGSAGARVRAAADALARAATEGQQAVLSGGPYVAVLDDAERAASGPAPGATPGADPAVGAVAPPTGGGSAKELLLRRVARAHWGLVDAVDAVDGAHDQPRRDELLGAVRTAAARCAGLGAALAPVVGEEAERYAEVVTAFERALARAGVTAAARAVLRSLVTAPAPEPSAHPPSDVAAGLGAAGPATAEDGYTLGRLHAFQQLRGELAEEDVEQCWVQASRPRRRRWLG